MRTTLLIVLLSLFCFSSMAWADWAEDFMAIFTRNGVDPAVEQAFKAGVAPVEIVKMTQQAGGVEQAAVVKALYCAGVSGSTVQAVALEAGVADTDVAAGYKLSVQQCGPAAALNPDPFSTTQNIASKGSPVSDRGEVPVIPPPSASPDRF